MCLEFFAAAVAATAAATRYNFHVPCAVASSCQPLLPGIWKRARCPLSAPSLPARVASAGNSTIIIDFELCLTRNVDSDSDCNDGDVGADIALSRSRAFFFSVLPVVVVVIALKFICCRGQIFDYRNRLQRV